MKTKLRLEQLESRDVPASLLAVGGLFIYSGDMQAHNVVISDDGHGDVAGVLDAGAPVFASGITTIEALSFFGASDNIAIIANARPVQKQSYLAEISGHTNLTVDDNVGSDSPFFTITVFRYFNDGATKIMLGPTGDETGQVVNVINFFSGGSVDVNRLGAIGGYANDTITSLSSAVRSSLKVDAVVGDSYTAGYFGASSPGSTIAMNLTVEAGSTGQVEAFAYGAIGGGDSLLLDLLDNSGNSGDRAEITHGPGAIITATANVAVLSY
ncbi:MAG TPA: hypothetical protein VGZ47_14615 [Gemmataceae bacterium]|jgi:hypothetical protein|nr:hypothetical protein [Gemmataceae bacterium]